jgi:hypothetical protein
MREKPFKVAECDENIGISRDLVIRLLKTRKI